jgi:hypothetical protein
MGGLPALRLVHIGVVLEMGRNAALQHHIRESIHKRNTVMNTLSSWELEQRARALRAQEVRRLARRVKVSARLAFRRLRKKIDRQVSESLGV